MPAWCARAPYRCYYPCGGDGETEVLRGLILHASQASPKAVSQGFEPCRHRFPQASVSLSRTEGRAEARAFLPAWLLCPGCTMRLCLHARPLSVRSHGTPPVLSVQKVAAGAGGASLGLCRLRHVLDTGLSGLEPKHKGRGRRRNKGLFHAATEKLQISKRAVQAGGAGAATDPPRPGSAALGLGTPWPPEAS